MKTIFKSINNYKSMQIQAKASIWYTICNVLQKGISFMVMPIYVRVLTTGEYGKYTVFQSWRDILIIFATLNLYCGVFTKAMVDYDDDRDVYTSSMQGLSTLITLAVLLIYLIASGFWNAVFDMDTITMLIMIAYFVFYPAYTFWSVRKKVENKYVCMVIITLIVSVATPIISLLFLFFTDMRENAVIRGYLIVQCVIGVYFYIYQYIKGKVFYHKIYWVRALKFNIPLIPHYLSLIVLGQVDRIMIKHFCGDDKAGIYSLAYQLSNIMNIFVNAINSSFVPWIYEKLKMKEYNRIRIISKQLCLFMAIMTLGVTIIAPEIVLIIGTREYMEAIWVIPAVALSVFFTFCYNLFCNIEFYYSETHYVMMASMAGAILNIILNAYFIPRYGFIAAGYTTLLCYFIFMIMHYLFMKKICRKQNLGTYVFDNKYMGVVSLILTLLSLLCMKIYSLVYVRYLFLIIICIFTLSRKDDFIEMRKEENGDKI